MRTSTQLKSLSPNSKINQTTTLLNFNENCIQSESSPFLQQYKLKNESQSQNQSSTPSDFFNQFNLLLLSKQLSSFQNEFCQSSNVIGGSNKFSNEREVHFSDKLNNRSSFSDDLHDQDSLDEQKQAEQLFQSKIRRPFSQNKQIVDENIDCDQETRNQASNEKCRTFSFNQNINHGQQSNQVTHQQLLLGLIGIEQQLKKLQDQSSQNHSNACSNSSSRNLCEEDENFSQYPQFVSFNNIEGINFTPSNKKLEKGESKKNILQNSFSIQKQASCISTSAGDNYSSNILTPSTKINIMNQSCSPYKFESEKTQKIHSTSINNLSLERSSSVQFNDINEFCLDDDEDNVRIETSTMSESKSRDFNKIKEVIYFIVNNLYKDEEALAKKRLFIKEDDHFADKRNSYLVILDQLIKKFKHLKKTKEEKTKFVMRKAFRYLFAQLKTHYNSKMNLKEANEICMKHYFSQHVNDSQFVLPFRRNSQIKTMNAAFLKKVFSSAKFVQDYKDFLNFFDRLSLDDNSKKVDQLAYYILPMIEDNKIEKIDGLRRLPWTMNLLDSTRSLAYQLLEFEENHSPSNNQQICQQTINQNFGCFQNINESRRETVSIFNNPSFISNNYQTNDENLSNFDTLSVQTQNRKSSDPFINMDLISRKLSISSNDSQNNQGINSQEIEIKSDSQGESQMNYFKQINNVLEHFQNNLQQQQLQKQKSKNIMREVIILTPPLYDLNEAPRKKFQFNFCNEK